MRAAEMAGGSRTVVWRNMRKVGISCVIAHRCGFSHVAMNFRFRSSWRRVGPTESGSNLRRDELVYDNLPMNGRKGKLWMTDDESTEQVAQRWD